MKEIKKDLFDCLLDPDVDAICITTNGHWTLDGTAVMGGGCAGIAARRWPETAKRLGALLKHTKHNVPFIIGATDDKGDYLEPTVKLLKDNGYKCLIFSFPTINDLMDGADIDLIVKSATMLTECVTKYGLKNVILARPGVGIGGLSWSDVKPEIENILDDRFTIVSFKHEV